MSGVEDCSRADRLAGDLDGLELDALLVESLVDVRYLTGFSGSNGAAVIFSQRLASEFGPHRFYTDFRYVTQSAAQVPDCFARETLSGEMLEGIFAGLDGAGGRLGFDESSITVKGHRRMLELLPDRWELAPCSGAVAKLRAVKDAGEIASMRAASELADEALKSVLEEGLAGPVSYTHLTLPTIYPV